MTSRPHDDPAQIRATFLRIAQAEPSPGQLIRALEALGHLLQRGATWEGYEERLADLETLAIARTGEALESGRHDEAARALFSLMREHGFEGNCKAYEDVRNSFIDRVLQTGHGIPISLSAVAIHLAEVSGVDLQGIGFPGHFIVGVNLDGVAPTIFDPFSGGQTLSFTQLAELYSRATGRQLNAHAPMLRDALTPTSTHAIVIRFCNNLHHHYTRRGSHDRAAEVVKLLAELHPRGAELRRLAGKLERRVSTLN